MIARTTSFSFKGKAVDVRQIGRDLGVRYVLEGSVRRLGTSIGVNVQLTDAEIARSSGPTDLSSTAVIFRRRLTRSSPAWRAPCT